MYAAVGATLADWRREAGDCYAVLEPLLTPTGQLARRWSRPGKPAMRIVEHDDDRAVAVCDEELDPPLELQRSDRVMHRVDERRLRKALCESLGLDVSNDALVRLPGWLPIGRWRLKPAAAYPVSLVIGSNAAHLTELLVSTVAGGNDPQIVLTPTRAFWTTRTDSVAAAAKATLVPLESALSSDGHRWSTSDEWDHYLGEFVKRACISMSPGLSARVKKVRVAKTGGTAAKLKDGLKAWGVGAKKRLRETGELLPLPEVKMLAKECGVDPSTASRWLNGRYSDQDRELQAMWAGAKNPDYVRRFPT